MIVDVIGPEMHRARVEGRSERFYADIPSHLTSQGHLGPTSSHAQNVRLILQNVH
jgi:hypothetical protein